MKVVVGYKEQHVHASFDLLARSFASAFRCLGFNAEVCLITPELPQMLEPADLYLQFPIGLEFKPCCQSFVYNCDLLPFFEKHREVSLHYWEVIKDDVLKGASVLDYDKSNVAFIRSSGRPAYHCPIGYSDLFRVPRKTKPARRGIYFIGSKTSCRRRLLQDCHAQGVTTKGVPGLKESLLIAEGVHLLLRNCPVMPFDSLRAMLLLANKRCVVSETPDTWSPFMNGVHWVTTSASKMPKIVRDLKNDHGRCLELGAAGYGFVVGAFRQEQILEKVLKTLRFV